MANVIKYKDVISLYTDMAIRFYNKIKWNIKNTKVNNEIFAMYKTYFKDTYTENIWCAIIMSMISRNLRG